MIFGRLLGGAGGSGETCLSLQILQNGDKVHSRPAPPAGVRRILRATPSAAGPFWLVGIAILEPGGLLFDIPGTILGLESTSGSNFGVSEAPWEAILAPRDHPGEP